MCSNALVHVVSRMNNARIVEIGKKCERWKAKEIKADFNSIR